MSISVLLVDDEERFIQTLAKRLTVRRMDVVTATSGHEALALLEGRGVDVLVVDVKMPGMDGIELTRAIKKHHPMIEIILVTGHADLEASAECMRLGAFDYLLKPVAIDELVYKIEDACRSKNLREEKIEGLRRASTSTGGDGE